MSATLGLRNPPPPLPPTDPTPTNASVRTGRTSASGRARARRGRKPDRPTRARTRRRRRARAARAGGDGAGYRPVSSRESTTWTGGVAQASRISCAAAAAAAASAALRAGRRRIRWRNEPARGLPSRRRLHRHVMTGLAVRLLASPRSVPGYFPADVFWWTDGNARHGQRRPARECRRLPWHSMARICPHQGMPERVTWERREMDSLAGVTYLRNAVADCNRHIVVAMVEQQDAHRPSLVMHK